MAADESNAERLLLVSMCGAICGAQGRETRNFPRDSPPARRSRKPFRAFGSDEGSNPSPSAPRLGDVPLLPTYYRRRRNDQALRSELDRARANAQLLAEGVDDRGIELGAAAALELFERFAR